MKDAYSSAPFQAGEKLRYRVHWKFIELGTLLFVQDSAAPRADGSPLFVAGMTVDSSPSLPFVDVHFTNRSILDPQDPANSSFLFRSSRADSTRVVYRRENGDRPLFVGIYRGPRPVFEDSVARQGPVYDSVGLFMALRCLASSGMYVTVPTIVDREIHPTRVRFGSETRWIRVPAFPHGILARRVEGDADWATGSCAGLTGRFWGWVSADERAVPLRIGMQIALGSVVLDLQSSQAPADDDLTGAQLPPGGPGGASRVRVAEGSNHTRVQ